MRPSLIAGILHAVKAGPFYYNPAPELTSALMTPEHFQPDTPTSDMIHQLRKLS